MQLDNMLLQACKNNQKSVVQTFLKRGGIDVNKRDESGNTPLIYACMKNSRDIVRLLLENGADAGLENQKSRTPLHFAANTGNYEITAMLVNAGADVNCTDSEGITPLMLMALNGKTDAALKFIQNKDVDISIKDKNNRTAVDYATQAGLRELVKALSQSEGEHSDLYGNTSLHHACWNGQGEVVKVLIENGTDVNKLNDDGESPLILASQNGRNDFSEMLISEGADVNAVDNRQHSALYYASEAGFTEIVEQLLMAGAQN